MCGILGYIDYTSKRNLDGLNTSGIKNRGPDNEGSSIDNNVAFYHTRLAVVDQRTTSNQPILSSCGNYKIICNGEIYNYRELKDKYKGYSYQTSSDSETILAAYVSRGVEGLQDLKGTYVFGLYDMNNNVVYVARDAVGKKPLFYYASKDCFIFSSSVQVIKDNLSKELSWNQKAFASYIETGFVRPDISVYEDISPLMPGDLIRIDIQTGENQKTKLIPQSYDYGSFDFQNREAVLAESERLLDLSIERRLQGIQKPVLLFSGGIDSTVLAQKMFEISGGNLSCVSLKPLIPMTQDEPYARYAAHKIGAKYLSVGFSIKSLKGDLCSVIDLMDQPMSIYAYFFLTLLTRKAREFGNTLFLGDGGDEVFYGYGDVNDWFDAEEKTTRQYPVGPEFQVPLSAWGIRQAHVDLLGHSFVKVDKATSEQQMEARCPFLDWDLMQFIRLIPKEHFLESKRTKHLLKKMLTMFPEWFLERKKIGFAYQFRYLLMPYYRQLHHEINFNVLESVMGHDIFGPFRDYSFKKTYISFDLFWKAFILSRFLFNRGYVK